jgi:ribosomal-protein-alanine N-acetyltransferase
MIIRIGNAIDLEPILSIEKRAFPELPWSREMINQELQENLDRNTWVTEADGNIIGYCMVRYKPGESHLINMAIEPSYQKMGVGQKLLLHILDHIPNNSSVFLEVKRGNFPAINLYLDAGFEEVAIREKYYTDGEDAIIMCLKV